MKSAIFGGSFNPVHLGHIALAKEVINIGYERIVFVPAKKPPHKVLVAGAKDKDRFHMLKLAIEDFHWALIWRGELEGIGISYSIDTVHELQRCKIVEERPGFIIGNDLTENFSKWKQARRLAESVNLLVARRKPQNIPFAYPHEPLHNELWAYSSSEVRASVDDIDRLQSMVPGNVAAYIREKGLYSNG